MTPRSLLLLTTAVGLLVAAPGSSQAAPPPTPALAVTGPQAATVGFPPVPVLVVAGQSLTLANGDVTGHDITSKLTRPVKKRFGKKVYTLQEPLFRSESVPSGGQGDVKGVAGLKPGTYQFYCSLHTSMSGTMMVQAAG